MWITADAENFRAENFEIFNFYGVETCFAWQRNLLVVFPYVQTIRTPKLPLIVAPREIKCLRCFGGRVFVLCKPAGVYKFMQEHKFLPLSQSALSLGPAYYQVYSPQKRSEGNHWLHLKDKRTRSDKPLFRLQSTYDDTYNICDLTLSSTNSDYALRRSLHQLEEGNDEDINVIAHGKKLFKTTQNDVRIVYRAEQEIVDIVGITKEETVVGFVLVAAASAVLAYVVDEKLIFSNIYLDSEVRGLCAGINKKFCDTIWIAHVDASQIYYSTKTISSDTFRRIRTENKRCSTIRNYKNKVLLCLSESKQLLECPIESLALGNDDGDEFVDLRSDMLKGSDRLVNEICQGAKDLQSINENLLDEQEKLKRINIYAHKQAIIHLPNVRVVRIADRMFLRIKFSAVLPMNCQVIAVLRSNRQTTYCTKLVDDSEIVVDVPVENKTLDSSLSLGIDLVTLADESRAWCLVRDYTKNPEVISPAKNRSDKSKFLTAKLAALRNLTTEGNLDMKKLSGIKKSIRRELCNL